MTIKPWMTKVLALALMAIGYVLNHEVIPPGYKVGGISLAGALTSLLVALAGIGISGPQLWPQVATMLGNGPAKPTPVVPPPSPPDVPR